MVVGHWVRVVLGPLPATVLLLPILLAGGMGTAIALVTVLFDPARTAEERWATVALTGVILLWVAAASVGVLALWVVVLAPQPVLRGMPVRGWLAASLALGLIAALCWLWTMAAGDQSDPKTWAVWLGLLLGPLVLGGYYLVRLVRR